MLQIGAPFARLIADMGSTWLLPTTGFVPHRVSMSGWASGKRFHAPLKSVVGGTIRSGPNNGREVMWFALEWLAYLGVVPSTVCLMRLACMPDIWSALSDQQRQRLELGNEAYRVLKRGETIERWYQVGVGCQELQQAALDYGRSNNTNNRAYREAWASLAAHVPDLRDIDKSARSHAIWMTENWEALSRWLATLPVNQRLDLNHPRSIHRKFDAAHKPPPPPDETKAPSTRVKTQDQIVQLTEQLDAQRKMKTTGAIPPHMTMEDLADLIANQRNAATVRRLIAALERRVVADERQDRLASRERSR